MHLLRQQNAVGLYLIGYTVASKLKISKTLVLVVFDDSKLANGIVVYSGSVSVPSAENIRQLIR